MTATAGFVGLGTTLKMSAASPVNYVLIGECKDINIPGVTAEFVDFTHQQSTGGYREYKPTFKISNNLTTKANWSGTDAEQNALMTAFQNSTLAYFQVTYPNAKVHTFTAYVSKVGYNAPLNGPLELDLELRITGPVVET